MDSFNQLTTVTPTVISKQSTSLGYRVLRTLSPQRLRNIIFWALMQSGFPVEASMYSTNFFMSYTLPKMIFH